MQKNKDNLLEKIVKKNYNNRLENILEKKYYEENVKSILLSILYKIETAYKDYAKVKVNVETKEEFIENLIRNIKDNCETIKVIKINSQEKELLGNKTFLIEKKIKKIICYPIERKLLYAIYKISKKDKIIKDKYFLINKTLSNLINIGSNINSVEPLRDFNGYSWTTIPQEIESIEHNIIYQNLIILLGNEFLNKWINNKEYIIDYMELLENRLQEKYGEKEKNKILESLKKISILLEIKFNPSIKRKMQTAKEKIEKELSILKDNKKFVENVTKQKIELTKQIREIDEIMNNKDLLQKEYEKRNENLLLEEKIFSVRTLLKLLEEERNQKINILEKLNDILKPKNFVKHKNKLEENYKYLKYTKIENIQEEIEKEIIRFQKIFMDCYKKKLENVESKEELLKIIYEYRYYNMIPLTKEKMIYQEEKLQAEQKDIIIEILKKANELKLTENITKRNELNYYILKNIFTLRTINLEELYIKIVKEKDKYFLQIFDENAYEEKIEIQEDIKKDDFNIKMNKKIKLINS